ncbi:hypothetical protein [Xylophilus sp. GOD-11R]|uniref:hypothetical protein n=1 Tax=Xylophilus sp. GOD-11R TaxID=3089814 RepID=UPI00298CCAB5|nr:hypothetical protein [Xylophilus sp. GOD-11R]WPB58638.1 hypothetical protein R9X41_08380 [Xylophilus sp. GOD-11R]
MKNAETVFRLFFAAIGALFLTCAMASSICDRKVIKIGFFNGVANSDVDAKASLVALKDLGDANLVFPDHDVTYTLFYNPTSGFFLDALEAAYQKQKSENFDISSYLFAHYMSGLSLPDLNFHSFFNATATEIGNAAALIQTLPATSDYVATFGPDAEAISLKFAAKIFDLRNDKYKQLLVAHSQGNLFLQSALAKARVGGMPAIEGIKVVQIAPPTAQIIEPGDSYFTASNDLIIRAVKNALPPSPRNLNNPTFFGHELIDSYLSDHGPYLPLIIAALNNKAYGLTQTLLPCENSDGGFYIASISCKLNADGTGTITAQTAADLMPGEQLTVSTGPGSYAKTVVNTDQIVWDFPREMNISSITLEYQASTCSPSDGLSLNPTYYASCYNPKTSAKDRKTWLLTKGTTGITNMRLGTNSLWFSVVRTSTYNLNGSWEGIAAARPASWLHQRVTCTDS